MNRTFNIGLLYGNYTNLNLEDALRVLITENYDLPESELDEEETKEMAEQRLNCMFVLAGEIDSYSGYYFSIEKVQAEELPPIIEKWLPRLNEIANEYNEVWLGMLRDCAKEDLL